MNKATKKIWRVLSVTDKIAKDMVLLIEIFDEMPEDIEKWLYNILTEAKEKNLEYRKKFRGGK